MARARGIGYSRCMTDGAAIPIRAARPDERTAIWAVIEPAIRGGETYALPRDIDRAGALAYWCAPDHVVFVAEAEGRVAGTYFLCANRPGGGDHVANCGYVTAPWAGGRGLARAMCAHSIAQARARGFGAMQYNFVIATNRRAIALWRSFGFETVGRFPASYRHPSRGAVDALVMHRRL